MRILLFILFLFIETSYSLAQRSKKDQGLFCTIGFKQCYPKIDLEGFPQSFIGTNYKLGALNKLNKLCFSWVSLNVWLNHLTTNYVSSDLGSYYSSGGNISKNKVNVELEVCPSIFLLKDIIFMKSGFFIGYNSFPDISGYVTSSPSSGAGRITKEYNYTFSRGFEAGLILGGGISFPINLHTNLFFDYDFRLSSINLKNNQLETGNSTQKIDVKANNYYFTSNLGVWYILH